MKSTNHRPGLFALAAVCAVTAAIFLTRSEKPPASQGVTHSVLEPLVIARRTAAENLSALRPTLRQLVDPATSPRQRIDLAMNCESDLTEPEIELLLGEISNPVADDKGLGDWQSQYFHEICVQLHRHASIRDRFARVLAGVAGDQRQDHVVRDYAVQHLRRVWHLAADAPDLRRAVIGTFQELADGSPEVAGAALLSLHFLGSDQDKTWQPGNAAVSNAEIEPLVTRILRQDPATIEAGVLMAAMRTAGDRAMPDPVRRLEAIAGNPSVGTVARMMAVSIIAKSHESPEKILLSIDRSDPRIDQAIRLSLRNTR